jgi:hypothetical protein
MEITYCFLPNAFGPPHLGHVMNVMANRKLYTERPPMRGTDPVLARWVCCFDTGSSAESENLYLELMSWMGCAAEEVVRLNDPNTQGAIYDGVKLLPPVSGIFAKLGWLQLATVTKIARGGDQRMTWMTAYDNQICQALEMSVPEIVWTPCLCNEIGVVLHHGADREFLIDFANDDPERVMRYVEDILHDAEPGEMFNVPLNWRDACSPSIVNTGDHPTSAVPAPKVTTVASPAEGLAPAAQTEYRGLLSTPPEEPVIDQGFLRPLPAAPRSTSPPAPVATTSPAYQVSTTAAADDAGALSPSPPGRPTSAR